MKHVPTLLEELRSPTSPSQELTALRRIKNEIVGHPQRKEIWVRCGVLDALRRILSRHQYSQYGEHDTVYEDIVLQTIIVVGSIAQGGARFVGPLAAAQIIPMLASILDFGTSSPQIVLGALRVLNTFAESSLLLQWKSSNEGSSQLRQLYDPQNVSYLVHIMEQNPMQLATQQQITLTAVLIGKTCDQESYRKQLSASGMLEALASQLIPFMYEGNSDAKSGYHRHSSTPTNHQSITNRTRLAPILQAIASIVGTEKRRSERFLSALASLDSSILGSSQPWQMDDSSTTAPAARVVGDSSQILRNSPPSSMYPPLGGMAIWGKSRPVSARGVYSSPADVSESPLASWLGFLVRCEQSVTKLMAAWLLAILFKHHLVVRDRERSISMQLIPVLARMLDADGIFVTEKIPAYESGVIQPPEWLIKRLAPHVLSLLVSDSKPLQLAAHEAGVIKKLSQLLKQTFDSLPREEAKPLWSTNPKNDAEILEDAPLSTVLGSPGLTQWACQVLQMRESVLEALASMATQEDELRKSIIGNGVVQYIVASLQPDPQVVPSGTAEKEAGKIHNPTPVLMQACAAATALSRSVSTLRTSLIDAGLAKPIYALLRYPDIQVQIAATGATCNIVLEFSPMRQEMIEDGVLKVLCQQAHSNNMHLRLNSLWALKHLAHTAPNSLKISCVQNLGASWLKQIICNDVENLQRPSQMGMGTPNAAGERVDLLNADDSSRMMTDSAVIDDDDEVLMVDGSNAEQLDVFDELGKAPVDQEDAAERARRLRVEATDVQEQALHLIRNLISGPGSSAVDMVDFIFKELGQQTLFDILTNLLRPRPSDLSTSRGQRAPPSQPPPTQASPASPFSAYQASPIPQIAAAVIHVLVHLAGGGGPRHRQLLLSQSELMRLVVQLASHPNQEVRSVYAWLGINLSWLDDAGDRRDARNRVLELRKLGMVERLEVLQSDSDLDVRERAKAAVEQIRKAEAAVP